MKVFGKIIRISLIYVCFSIFIVLAQEVFVSNLDSQCVQCLCRAASNCDMTAGCSGGHCGPFQLGYQYWIDAGRPTLYRDDPYTITAFYNCALTFHCARGTIKHYIAKYGKDCNNDRVTNCDDFAMINFNGAFECNRSLNLDFSGKMYMQRYQNCKHFDNT